ncbi:acyl carrier protein phosphodiesterase [Opitutaceae bacterium TAV1]|nr:acyl carrier protein phosphodiesterase [Opitutaceae bacterium TAV1]
MNTNTTTPVLLHIDASPRGERSHSRRLGRDFNAAWQSAHPAGRIVNRDLGHEPPPFVTEAWVEGAFTAPAGHSPGAREAILKSDALVDELLAASEIVITTPIYNLSLPAALKAWIDQIVRVGRTFSMGSDGYKGHAKARRVTIIVASGSDFRPDGPNGSYNFIEPYLRGVLGFIGLTDVQFIYAHSLNDGNPQREASLTEAQAAVQQLAVA